MALLIDLTVERDFGNFRPREAYSTPTLSRTSYSSSSRIRTASASQEVHLSNWTPCKYNKTYLCHLKKMKDLLVDAFGRGYYHLLVYFRDVW